MKLTTMLLVALFAPAIPAPGATVVLVATGTINQEWTAMYPSADFGDSFRLTVTYTDGATDTDPSTSVGVYFPGDLSVSLEILGEGTLVLGSGGAISIVPSPIPNPPLTTMPAITFSVPLAGGNTLMLLFSDENGSSLIDDALPTEFGMIDDYDAVGFSIIPLSQMEPSTPAWLGGSVSLIGVPEPTSPILLGIGASLSLLRRNRPQTTEGRTRRRS